MKEIEFQTMKGIQQMLIFGMLCNHSDLIEKDEEYFA